MTDTTALAAITLATIDPITAAEDVIADAITGAITEVYPEGADPVWVNPTGAVVIPARLVTLILEAAVVGLEGSDDADADAALYAVTTLLANAPALEF